MTCPNCSSPLKSAHELKPRQPSTVKLWCSNTKCKSKAAKDGAAGTDEDDAFLELENAVVEENNNKASKWENL